MTETRSHLVTWYPAWEGRVLPSQGLPTSVTVTQKTCRRVQRFVFKVTLYPAKLAIDINHDRQGVYFFNALSSSAFRHSVNECTKATCYVVIFPPSVFSDLNIRIVVLREQEGLLYPSLVSRTLQEGFVLVL